MTINPIDLHDPVAQVFAGEDIDMDKFEATAGPDAFRRARNVAKDAFAATRFFNYIIHTTLETLFGIHVTRDRVWSEMGVLGCLSGYFGVVEAQGRGTLHLHIFLWLFGAPNADEMHTLLKTEEFRQKIVAYIRENIRAHLDAFGEEEIKSSKRESDIGYSRPPNPNDPNWEENMKKFEYRVVRSQQIHKCTKNTCLVNKSGRQVCKRRAPWPLSDDDSIDENGNWNAKRTYGYLNTYCPPISVTLRCNNDIQLITNGRDTKNVVWYETGYQTKKQGKSFNISALFAKALLYHTNHSAYLSDILEQNRLLIYRCFLSINVGAELSDQQVISYLMGWGDTFCSHHYVPFYWASLGRYIIKAFPHLYPSGEQ